MDIDSDLENAAEECAGNWKEFGDFYWDHAYDDDAEDWCIYTSSSRDSKIAEKSNEHVMRQELSKFGEDVREERHNHWGPGYVDNFVIRVYDENRNITEAFKEFHSMLCALSEHPLLDDSDNSQREYEAALDAISNVCPEHLEEGEPEKIFSWLCANEQRELDDVDGNGAYPSKESVMRAMYALGFAQHEEENE